MNPSDKRLYELEQRRNKTLPPGSRWHQWWCAIFQGCRCDCDDDQHRDRKRRSPPSRGGELIKDKHALEDA